MGRSLHLLWVVAGAVALVAQGGPPEPVVDRGTLILSTVLSGHVPAVLPVTLPDGVELEGASTGETITSTLYARRPQDGSHRGSVVEVVVTAPGPGGGCPAGDATSVQRRSGRDCVLVNSYGATDDGSLDHWRTVELTDDPDRVAWLD